MKTHRKEIVLYTSLIETLKSLGNILPEGLMTNRQLLQDLEQSDGDTTAVCMEGNNRKFAMVLSYFQHGGGIPTDCVRRK
uniref:Uncharacterized protein n=1 Tax=Megaselia scalaris TaxID=36166 RepID=T1GSM5_MEGSC